MLEVKVIADSTSPLGVRLTTLQCTYPRMIHAEVMTHRMFCLSGDSVLHFDLPRGLKSVGTRPHTMTLREFVKKWTYGVAEHKPSRFKVQDMFTIIDSEVYSAFEISLLTKTKVSNLRGACRSGKCIVQNPTKKRIDDFMIKGEDYKAYRASMGIRTFKIQDRLKRMNIRQLNETTGLIQHSNVTNCCYSGIKEVFKVVGGDYSVSGTKDHVVLTSNGWKKIGDLLVGVDKLIVQKFGVLENERRDSLRLRKIEGSWRSKWQKDIRPLLLDTQEGKCATCKCEVDTLEAHHVIPVHKDTTLAFDKSNVILLCPSCHNEAHKAQGCQVSQYLYGAEVDVDSVTLVGDIDTYDLEIGGEFANFLANGVVVHNSRNSSSTRAIPTAKLANLALEELVEPFRWGCNSVGMQASEFNFTGEKLEEAKAIWNMMAAVCSEGAKKLAELGLHKQWAGRPVEWFSNIRVIISSTEWSNFLELRDHEAAQPEIQELAKEIRKALDNSNPRYLRYGDWHLPYITEEEESNPYYTFPENKMLLPQISAARCCRVSYLKHDGTPASINEDLMLCDKLIGAAPKHFSPFEHVAQPWHTQGYIANFKGWKQYRKILEGL